MKPEQHPIDEYTLAAYLAGTLPEVRRREVAAYLAQSEDARVLLRMAQEALDAAHQPGPHPAEAPARPTRLPAHVPRRRQAAPPAPREHAPRRAPRWSPRWSQAGRFAAAAMLVVALGAGLRTYLVPSTDALRSSVEAALPEIKVRVHTPEMSLTWEAVPNTYRYRLVVWDPEEAAVVAEHETKRPHVEADDPFAARLREALRPGRTYTLRIDAMDARNRLIRQSEAVELAR